MFSIKGSRGRFKFKGRVVNEANGAEWIEAFGGSKNHEEFRAFRIDQVSKTYKQRG